MGRVLTGYPLTIEEHEEEHRVVESYTHILRTMGLISNGCIETPDAFSDVGSDEVIWTIVSRGRTWNYASDKSDVWLASLTKRCTDPFGGSLTSGIVPDTVGARIKVQCTRFDAGEETNRRIVEVKLF